MTLIPKLQTALSVVFILTTAGAISITAQTQAVADNSSANAASTAATTSEPKKAEVAKPSTMLAKNTSPDKTSEVSRDAGNSNAVASASTVETSPGTAAPQGTQPAPADKWQFQFTPYLWIAGISGRAGIGNLSADVSSGVTDSSVHINFGFMGALEAHKDKIVILTDLQYSDLGTKSATPGPGFSGVETSFKTFILDPEVGYRVVDNPDKGAFVDVLGGIRYWHLRTDLNFAAGLLAARSVTASRGWVDGVFGIRGKAALSKKWFVTGKADVGGGGSKFTYQVFGGVGVMVAKKVALIGGYRALHVNYDKDNFLFDMTLHGPILGVGFKF